MRAALAAAIAFSGCATAPSAVRFPSPVGPLLAWYAAPASDAPVPAIVYLHHDFELTPEAWEHARAFLDAGFAVMAPSWRGENGNPGARELLAGEIDDACAAIEWLAARPEIDGTRVFAFGHSIGGGIASLVSLRADAKVRLTASVGGIYQASAFGQWARRSTTHHLITFDLDDPAEVRRRLFIARVGELIHPHVAYAGQANATDVRDARDAEAAARTAGVDVRAVIVEGDHMSSIHAAIADFTARARSVRSRRPSASTTRSSAPAP